MRLLYWATCFWTAFGLVFGVFYREFTKSYDFTGETQLAVVHTHSLVLGMIMFLVLIALNAVLNLDSEKLFKPFFYTYNFGLLYMMGMMIFHGIYQVQGKEFSPDLSMVSGMSHIVMTIALVMLLMVLYRALRRSRFDI